MAEAIGVVIFAALVGAHSALWLSCRRNSYPNDGEHTSTGNGL
jgi:hypothetical protein